MSKHKPGTSSVAEVLTVVSAADQMGERVRPLDWEISRRLVRAMRRYPALFLVIMALAAAIALLNGALPHLAGLVIAWPIEQPDAFAERFGLSARAGLWCGAGAVAVLGILWVVVMRLRFMAVALMAERVAHDLRSAMHHHLQLLGIDYFDRTKVGWIIARGGGDIEQVRSAISQVIPRLVIAVLQMIYAVIAIGLWDGVLLLILLGIAPIVYLLNWYFRLRLSTAHRAVRATYSRLTANLAESISGMRITQAFVREERNADIFHDLNLRHRANHLREARAQGVYVPTLDLAGQVFIVIALLVGGWRVEQGLMTLGALIGVMLMTRAFFQPITVLGEMYNLTLQAMAGGERIFQLLDTQPSITEPERPIPLPRASDEYGSVRGMRVEFDDVTFAYVHDRPVLDRVAFTAEPGETIAIVGHTGAGKTTIISLLAKFYLPTAGDIRLDGVSMRALASDDLHTRLAMVQQQNFLFSGSVRENIRFVRPEADDEAIMHVCGYLGCADLILALPRGLDTEVGERGENLSLGQRQIVCFARAMLAEPRLLLLDEATSAVDTVTEARIQTAVERLVHGRTSFIVAHRLSTIRRADRVLVMEHGRLVESGTHEQLLARGGRYTELYDRFIRLSTGEEER